MLDFIDTFARRHLGSSSKDIEAMLKVVNAPSLDALIDQTVPKAIRAEEAARPARAEGRVRGARRAARHRRRRTRSSAASSALGYSDTITPGVILRNILLNPGWYTAYTPYQAEIAQGRLEALLNYQTMIGDLTGLPVANASLLDEGTAAAEAMHMVHAAGQGRSRAAASSSASCATRRPSRWCRPAPSRWAGR